MKMLFQRWYCDEAFSVFSDSRVSYPHPTGKWWFGCDGGVERSRDPSRAFPWSD